MNRPGFDAHLLHWEGGIHAEQVRRADPGEGGPAGHDHRDDYAVGVGGDHGGVGPAGDERRDAAEVDPPGRRSTRARPTGSTTAAAKEIRELKRRNAELERTVEILKAATSFFVRESDPHTAVICRVRRRASGSVRGRSDLPRAHRARLPDRPENLLRLGVAGAVETGLVGPAITEVLAGYYEPDERRPAATGVAVRVGEDVGPPATARHPGRASAPSSG